MRASGSALMRRLERHTLDRDAMHQAALALVVVQGVVPGRAIVPEGDRALGPGEAGLELRPRRMGVEEVEQRLALPRGPSFEMGGEVAVDVERGAPGFGMTDHHRMDGV